MQEEAKPHAPEAAADVSRSLSHFQDPKDCHDKAPEAAAAERVSPNQIAVDTHSRRRTDIDGLRAVAAAAVVLNHIDSAWLPGGFTGVDVFYVISGYVVALSSRSKPSTPLQFYARRVRRLMPTSLIVIVATVLAMSAVIPAEEPGLHVFYDTALCSLVGWANNFFVGREVAGIGEGYWGAGRASATWNPFTHFWRRAP